MAFIGNAFKSVVRHPLRAIPAIVGVATGDPLLVAAAAGGTTAIEGGKRSSILGSAVTGGLGTYAGNALGNTPMYASRFLGGSALVQGVARGAGTLLGTNMARGANEARRNALQETSTPSAPSMDVMQVHAQEATRQAFRNNGLYPRNHMLTRAYMERLRRRSNNYGYREWKDLIRRNNG